VGKNKSPTNTSLPARKVKRTHGTLFTSAKRERREEAVKRHQGQGIYPSKQTRGRGDYRVGSLLQRVYNQGGANWNFPQTGVEVPVKHSVAQNPLHVQHLETDMSTGEEGNEKVLLKKTAPALQTHRVTIRSQGNRS